MKPEPARRSWTARIGCLLAVFWCAPLLAADWNDLSPSQRRALAPLKSVWARADGTEQAMWLKLADRYRSLAPEEQSRWQQRMVDWSRMSPRERGQARVQFQEASQWSAADRRERWQAYQSLDPEARRALAERWKLEAAAREQERRQQGRSDGKRTVFEQPRPSPAPLKAATPTTVPARAGATTRPLLRRAEEPAAQQHGLPRIAATPSFVDPATLLPRRGPQGAAVVGRPASSPRQAP